MANQLKNYSVIILISCISLAACKKNIKEGAQTSAKKPPVLVDVLIADFNNLPSTVELNGNVLPQEMIEIRPEVSGRITQLMINDGAAVAVATAVAVVAAATVVVVAAVAAAPTVVVVVAAAVTAVVAVAVAAAPTAVAAVVAVAAAAVATAAAATKH